MSSLTEDAITFGKYKDLTLTEMLRDRKYCAWLVQQDWFENQYAFLYNRVLEYNPREYFVTHEHLVIEDNLDLTVEEFFESYEYFNLTPLEDLEIELSREEMLCYEYYLGMIDLLKNKIVPGTANPYDIKAPTSWLKKFEKKYGIPRETFKEFIGAYELPNLPYIVEDIKKAGGIEYKGARSYLIAKENSLKQEAFWEDKLKEKYGEDVGNQFAFRGCVFDAICITNKVLYEMKINISDFSEEQHKRYVTTLGTSYNMLYLIGTDCVINMKKQKVYTSNLGKYYAYILKIPSLKNPSKFDKVVETYSVKEVRDVLKYI